MRICDLSICAILVLGTAGRARADHSPEMARVHYARGVELAGNASYVESLQEFNQAYILSPVFAVLYNIGQCHVALGHSTDAVAALSRYPRDGGEQIPAARRAFVKEQLEVLKAVRMPRPPGSRRDEAVPPTNAGTSLATRGTARAHLARGNDLAAHGQYGVALREFFDDYVTAGDSAVFCNIVVENQIAPGIFSYAQTASSQELAQLGFTNVVQGSHVTVKVVTTDAGMDTERITRVSTVQWTDAAGAVQTTQMTTMQGWHRLSR